MGRDEEGNVRSLAVNDDDVGNHRVRDKAHNAAVDDARVEGLFHRHGGGTSAVIEEVSAGAQGDYRYDPNEDAPGSFHVQILAREDGCRVNAITADA
jgi:hypothetical protein